MSTAMEAASALPTAVGKAERAELEIRGHVTRSCVLTIDRSDGYISARVFHIRSGWTCLAAASAKEADCSIMRTKQHDVLIVGSAQFRCTFAEGEKISERFPLRRWESVFS